MKIAFLFPGQGAQTVGMGKEMYNQYEAARKVYTNASTILNRDIKRLCFSSTQEELAKTDNAQVAIATTSLAMLQVLKEKKIVPNVVAGLSLGEYVALMCAGILEPKEGLPLLEKRGYCMANFVPKEKYAMAAIIGVENKKIEEICEKMKKQGKFVVPANYNYSDQTVISGNEEAVEEVMELLKEEGRIVRLRTTGAFHTSKLEQARSVFSKELQKVNFHIEKIEDTPIKVMKNIDGTFYKKEDDVQQILSNHIVSPLRFDKIIEKMIEENIDTFIEVGPGRTLTTFVRKELMKQEKNMNNYAFFDMSNLKQMEEIL